MKKNIYVGLLAAVILVPVVTVNLRSNNTATELDNLSDATEAGPVVSFGTNKQHFFGTDAASRPPMTEVSSDMQDDNEYAGVSELFHEHPSTNVAPNVAEIPSFKEREDSEFAGISELFNEDLKLTPQEISELKSLEAMPFATIDDEELKALSHEEEMGVAPYMEAVSEDLLTVSDNIRSLGKILESKDLFSEANFLKEISVEMKKNAVPYYTLFGDMQQLFDDLKSEHPAVYKNLHEKYSYVFKHIAMEAKHQPVVLFSAEPEKEEPLTEADDLEDSFVQAPDLGEIKPVEDSSLEENNSFTL